VGGRLVVAEPTHHALLLRSPESAAGRYAGTMFALITSSMLILAITFGIPSVLALIAFGAVLTRPKR
jgi:hypothetical protein